MDDTELCYTGARKLARMIRARNDGVPIVVLSSREDEAGKVQALDIGADDYVTKPFGMDELLARLRAGKPTVLAALHAQNPQSGITIADVQADLKDHAASFREELATIAVFELRSSRLDRVVRVLPSEPLRFDHGHGSAFQPKLPALRVGPVLGHGEEPLLARLGSARLEVGGVDETHGISSVYTAVCPGPRRDVMT